MSSTQSSNDEAWMTRALALGERSFATPNPGVGCVLVRDGLLVGEGWTQPVGQAHAEVMALRAAGEEAEDATAYVTLEPCCHWGRTPPCTEALIRAKVTRVVVATTDSDPRVAGQGIKRLREAGISVTIGIKEGEARDSNADFFYFHETGMPFVTLKAAMTLDGKIATRTGSSKWITGAESRSYVHYLRARTGAVMVGINTLVVDDARLTVRFPDAPAPRQPLRIVVDSQLRTPVGSEAVKLIRHLEETDGIIAPLLIATTEHADRALATALEAAGVEVVCLPADAKRRVDLHALISLLGQRRIISLLVEGGGELGAALLEQRLVQRILFFIAPKLVGGRDAPTPLEGDGIDQMAQAIELHELKIRRVGADVAIEGRIY